MRVWSLIVWIPDLCTLIYLVCYCMGCASVWEDNLCLLLYGLCICRGRQTVLVIVWIVYLYVRNASVVLDCMDS